MIQAIVYESKAGHTKKYAEMLSEKINVKALNFKEASKVLKRNDEIIFLGWISATKIKGLNKAKKYNVKCIGAVGIYPKEDEYVKSIIKANSVNEPLYYLRGGLDLEKVGFFTKKLFNWIAKMMEIDNKPENKDMIELFKSGKDFVSEENLEEMLKYLEELN